MKREQRVFSAEIRTVGDSRRIYGTAVVFNRRSENLGGFVEQIDPAAFDGCDMSDVRCLVNHENSLLMGRTTSSTLRLKRTHDGLNFECDPPDTSYASDLAACMERGDINQCSFSFSVPNGGAEWSQDPSTGASVRTVKKIARLFDVSVVTYPAYPQTSSELRTSAEILGERNEAAAPRRDVRTDLCRRELDLVTIGFAGGAR